MALIWFVRRLFMQQKSEPEKISESKDMVQCEQCKTYLPKDDAVVLDDKLFCSQQHLDEWKESV